MTHSPHYSINQNLKYWIAQCDVKTAERAIDAVKYIASLDVDHAALANGRGFARSDVRYGHNLAKCPKEIALRSEILVIGFLKLARKYRRQLPPDLLVD